MKSSSCTTTIFVLGFTTILLLHSMVVLAMDPDDSFRSEWENQDAHPPLSRSETETTYFNKVLSLKAKPGMNWGRPCIRKEYRTLTDKERQALHRAFNLLKTSPIQSGTSENISQLDVMVGYHRFDVAMGAHYGPSFLPWHREFLCRLERALQKHDSNVCLPYVDWTLDQGIPVPGDSAIWTSKYLGNNYGPVISGLAAGWKIYPKDCARKWPNLYRTVVQDSSAKDRLFTDAKIDGIMKKARYEDICVPFNNDLEGSHNSIHVYVGGHMNMLSCAPNDPTFFFHHCFVDCIWQEFRMKRQKSDLETDYPVDPDILEYHRALDQMSPFDGLRNIDGLSKNYTKIYFCKERPVKCVQHTDCKSEILWCNNGRCLSKIREGGKCENSKSVSCYSEKCKVPTCENNICKCPK